MGRAARAKALRREQGQPAREAPEPMGRVEPRGHEHRRWLSCLECQRREDLVTKLAHRVRQQNEQIVGLHVLLDQPLASRPRVFGYPALDRSLPGRKP